VLNIFEPADQFSCKNIEYIDPLLINSYYYGFIFMACAGGGGAAKG
jgi:hypothetical protein